MSERESRRDRKMAILEQLTKKGEKGKERNERQKKKKNKKTRWRSLSAASLSPHMCSGRGDMFEKQGIIRVKETK